MVLDAQLSAAGFLSSPLKKKQEQSPDVPLCLRRQNAAEMPDWKLLEGGCGEQGKTEREEDIQGCSHKLHAGELAPSGCSGE